MTPTPPESPLPRKAKRHVVNPHGLGGPCCRKCGQDWPCDASVLIEELTDIRKRLDRIASINDFLVAHKARAALAAAPAPAAGQEEAVWAHVIRQPETHEPALLDDEALRVINEELSIVATGYFLDRSWIQPGPLLAAPAAAPASAAEGPIEQGESSGSVSAGAGVSQAATAPPDGLYAAGYLAGLAAGPQGAAGTAGASGSGGLGGTEGTDAALGRNLRAIANTLPVMWRIGLLRTEIGWRLVLLNPDDGDPVAYHDGATVDEALRDSHTAGAIRRAAYAAAGGEGES